VLEELCGNKNHVKYGKYGKYGKEKWNCYMKYGKKLVNLEETKSPS